VCRKEDVDEFQVYFASSKAVSLAGSWRRAKVGPGSCDSRWHAGGRRNGGPAAENSIKQVQVRRDGDQVLLKVQLTSPLKTLPGNWSVVDPPRVVIDFPETENQTGQTLQQIGEGDLKSLNLVQTDKLTRMVLNLYRPTKFSTEMVGDALFVRLQGQSPQASARDPGPSIFQPTPPPAAAGKAIAPVENAAVRDIVFRRGEDGQANIIIDLTDGSIPIDVRRTALGVSVEMRDVELPERLQNRRNVNDFATPVTSITSKGIGNVANLEIAARGRWFHQAHLANNQLTIEVRPIPVDDANKLVQSGEQGQKISINFFEADATMVVRTLAEISGKNIMIDPSLAGRRLTISLDSVPYDQALEIVMSQINAAMRVRDNIVLFGDRAILQKRDEDIADAAARAADIAQLVTEVFNLSYLKPTDFQNFCWEPVPVAARTSPQLRAPGRRVAERQVPAAAGRRRAAPTYRRRAYPVPRRRPEPKVAAASSCRRAARCSPTTTRASCS
jgi:type IV pilus assembly protein PilQ